MNCLIDYVGLAQQCGYIPSLSGMYLNQLPGIELKEVDEIANNDQKNFIGLWNDLQATAADTFREDVISEFGKRYLLKQITQTVDIGKQINTNNIVTTPQAEFQYGMLIETYMGWQSMVAQSNLLKIFIQELNFYCNEPTYPSVTITFQDADTNTVISTLNVANPVTGWNNIPLDMEFDARRLYVFVSGNMTSYAQLDLGLFNLNNFGGVWSNRGGFGFGLTNGLWFNWGNGCGCQSRINGVVFENSTNIANVGTNTFGLSAVLSSQCSFDTIVCNNKKRFASAWQHCLAIELMNYRINSSRLNRWTTIDLVQAKKLQALLTLKYRGGTDKDTGLNYPGKLQSVATGIVLNDNDCCLKNNDFFIATEAKL